MPAFSFLLNSSDQVLVSEGEEVSPGKILAKLETFSSTFKIPIASVLKIKPKLLSRYLEKQTGDYVKKDEIIAKKKGRFLSKTRKVISEKNGKLLSVDENFGAGVIGLGSRKEEVVSPGLGKVIKITNNDISIDFSGKEISLKEGIGKVIFAELVLLTGKDEEAKINMIDANLAGKIVFAGDWDNTAICKAKGVGIRGVLGIGFFSGFTKESSEKNFCFGDVFEKSKFGMGVLEEKDYLLIKPGKKVIMDGDNKRLCLLN